MANDRHNPRGVYFINMYTEEAPYEYLDNIKQINGCTLRWMPSKG